MLTLLEEYPYLYETHLHTSQGSACGGATGKAMAQACQEAGYTGIIVTDHNFGGNCAISKNLPWTDWVNGFCLGYEDAKEYGDQNDFDVFFGFTYLFIY